MIGANLLASNAGKILCVENLGELVKKWLDDSGIKPGDLARMVKTGAKSEPGKKVERQHIEQLIAAGDRTPRYIADLARAMGSKVDDLLALRMPAPHPRPGVSPPPAAPPPKFEDRRDDIADTDWTILEAVKIMVPEEQLADIVRRYLQMKQHVREDLAAKQAAANGASPAPQTAAKPHSRKDRA